MLINPHLFIFITFDCFPFYKKVPPNCKTILLFLITVFAVLQTTRSPNV